MEQRSLRVYQQKTFFSKLGTTISKILIPTKIGFNGVMISVKRNNLLKSYEDLKALKSEDKVKKENVERKYEDTFSLYLESIDKYIMDTIYKKVRNGNASSFEQEALSKYYTITNLKESQYLEYKYRKQKYLIELDYENIKGSSKDKSIKRYNNFYIEKMDVLYKGILKNYSVQLTDSLNSLSSNKVDIYDKVFDTVEEYILNILTLKMNSEEYKIEKEVIEQYDKYSKFMAGKFDSIDIIEKRMIILGLSRKLFTHSLPLIIAEKCYEQLLNEARSELVHAKSDIKTKKAYKVLLIIMEEYNTKLLSTKIYWEKQKEKEEFKKLWEGLKKANNEKNKEILYIKNDLKKISSEPERYKLVIDVYKNKLVELGAMKILKEKGITKEGKLEKKKDKEKQPRVKKETNNKLDEKVKQENNAPKKRGRPRKNG